VGEEDLAQKLFPTELEEKPEFQHFIKEKYQEMQ